MSKKNVTIHQVAALAQVAPITVSRVLNNSGYVSDEKRERVIQAAKQLNYTLHAGASELASRRGQARMLAVALPQLENPFFVRVLEGCQAIADERGYDVLVYNTRGVFERDRRAIESLNRRRVEGIIYAFEMSSDSFPTQPLTELFKELPTPIVFVEHALPAIQADSVAIDNATAGYQATRHLIEQGYQRIALVASRPDLDQDRQRWLGYQQAIAEADLPPIEVFIPPNQRKKQAGRAAVRALLDAPNPPDAIFAASTLITIGVFQGLKELKIDMPHQIGLIGYGEEEWTSLLVPSLSVVSRPAEELGRLAANLLFERLFGGGEQPPRQIMLPARLLVRASSSRREGGSHA